MIDMEQAKDEMIDVLKSSNLDVRRKNRELRAENDLLKRVLASAIGNKVVVLRYTGNTPTLELFENISGETVVRLRYDKKM